MSNRASTAQRRGDAVSLTELGLLLGLDRDDVVGLARKNQLPVKNTKKWRLPWELVAERFDLAEAHRIRRASANVKKALRTSRHWIAGYPELVAQWDLERNGDLYPWQVSRASAKRIWWRCPKGPDHAWNSAAGDRVRSSGCPFCQRRRVSVTNCLATIAPDLAAEWHPIKNGSLAPRDIIATTDRKVWWRCRRGPDHEWRAAVVDRVDPGTGCPCCANRAVSVTNCLSTVAPELAAEWHPKKNGKLTPRNAVAHSRRIVWWKCGGGPDHEWSAAITNRFKRGTRCPMCVGRRVSVTNSIAHSFPEVAAQWHPTKNRPLQPDRIAAGTQRRVWWKCPHGPDHEWEAGVASRTFRHADCPFCSHQRFAPSDSIEALARAARQWHPRRMVVSNRRICLRGRRSQSGGSARPGATMSGGPNRASDTFVGPAARCAGASAVHPPTRSRLSTRRSPLNGTRRRTPISVPRKFRRHRAGTSGGNVLGGRHMYGAPASRVEPMRVVVARSARGAASRSRTRSRRSTPAGARMAPVAKRRADPSRRDARLEQARLVGVLKESGSRVGNEGGAAHSFRHWMSLLRGQASVTAPTRGRESREEARPGDVPKVGVRCV